jgi:phosphonate transport system substrate-binding protein
MTMKRICDLLLLLALVTAGCAMSVDRTPPMPAKIVVGVQATKPDETRAAWQPLVSDLGRKLGVPMELAAASQADTVQALASGKVDIVWLSSSAAIDAVIDADARTVALYTNVNGTQGYKAVVVVRADSGIKSLEEALAPGKYRYAAGARTSTSGYVLPQHFLFGPRGTTAEGRFKSVSYGGHFPNLDALWAKQVDVSINNTTDLAVFQSRTPGAREGLVTLWESPLVPNDVLMVRADMPAATRQRLVDLFLGYGKTAEEKELFRKASGISHFAPADNAILVPVSEFKFATEKTPDQRRSRFMQSLAGAR